MFKSYTYHVTCKVGGCVGGGRRVFVPQGFDGLKGSMTSIGMLVQSEETSRVERIQSLVNNKFLCVFYVRGCYGRSEHGRRVWKRVLEV